MIKDYLSEFIENDDRLSLQVIMFKIEKQLIHFFYL